MDEMYKAKIFNLTAAVLIATFIVGFASCNKDKEEEPEPDLSFSILMGAKWYYYVINYPSQWDLRFYILFNRDNSYSFVTEHETINGIFKIKAKEETKYSFIYVNHENIAATFTEEATLYKMLASGSNAFDQLWVYHFGVIRKYIAVHLYNGSERVQIIEFFLR